MRFKYKILSKSKFETLLELFLFETGFNHFRGIYDGEKAGR